MTTVHVVEFVLCDVEGTFREVIGVASTPEQAEAIKAEHLRRLLEKRTKSNPYCAQCRFSQHLHGALREELIAAKERGLSIGGLLDCPYVPPAPVTKLWDDEEYEITPFEVDALPVEEG